MLVNNKSWPFFKQVKEGTCGYLTSQNSEQCSLHLGTSPPIRGGDTCFQPFFWPRFTRGFLKTRGKNISQARLSWYHGKSGREDTMIHKGWDGKIIKHVPTFCTFLKYIDIGWLGNVFCGTTARVRMGTQFFPDGCGRYSPWIWIFFRGPFTHSQPITAWTVEEDYIMRFHVSPWVQWMTVNTLSTTASTVNVPWDMWSMTLLHLQETSSFWMYLCFTGCHGAMVAVNQFVG